VSHLDLVLLVVLALIALGWIVTAVKLRAARREITELRQPFSRSRLVPSTSEAVRSVVGTAMKVRDQGFGGALRSSIDDLALWADVERPDLARMAARDGSITILFSDIENSTALNHRLGDRGWVQLLAKHDRLLKREIEANAGHVIKSQGDGFMVAFAEPDEAIRAAFAIQRQLSKTRSRRLSGVRVRIGTHKGSAVRRDGDLFGRNVAYAARVASQADGGQVLVSQSVLDALPDESVHVLDSREADLKGIPGTHVLHLLDWKAGLA
jgi:class 3 adenylate cyclase